MEAIVLEEDAALVWYAGAGRLGHIRIRWAQVALRPYKEGRAAQGRGVSVLSSKESFSLWKSFKCLKYNQIY